MNFIEYAPLGLRTAKPLEGKAQIQHAALGFITEVGELADAVKRHVIYEKPLDSFNFMEEVGDVVWYLNLLADCVAVHPKVMEHALTAPLPPAVKGVTLMDETLGLGVTVGFMSAFAVDPDDEDLKRNTVEAIQLVIFMLRTLLLSATKGQFTLEHSLDRNIAKLAARYGDKYSDFLALNRDTAVERTVLEGGTAT